MVDVTVACAPVSADTISVLALPEPDTTSSHAGSPSSCSTAATASTTSSACRSKSAPSQRRNTVCTPSSEVGSGGSSSKRNCSRVRRRPGGRRRRCSRARTGDRDRAIGPVRVEEPGDTAGVHVACFVVIGNQREVVHVVQFRGPGVEPLHPFRVLVRAVGHRHRRDANRGEVVRVAFTLDHVERCSGRRGVSGGDARPVQLRDMPAITRAPRTVSGSVPPPSEGAAEHLVGLVGVVDVVALLLQPVAVDGDEQVRSTDLGVDEVLARLRARPCAQLRVAAEPLAVR